MVSKTYRNDGLEGRPTTIATTVSWVIDPGNEADGVYIRDYMARYVPFNSLFVRNNDSNEVEIYPNGAQSRKIALPQGATVTVLNEPFRWLVLKNIGSGTVAQSNIVVKIERLSEKQIR